VCIPLGSDSDSCGCGRTVERLIAYAIGVDDTKTGRCLVLGGPWDHAQDRRLLAAARGQPWWDSASGGAKVNVERLADWLAIHG
jgi:hypothetical protein